jgi:arginyl-tRNA synthetase
VKIHGVTDPVVLLEARVAAALGSLGPEAVAVGPQVRRSKVADYQVNAAFEAAKRLGRNPRELAAELLGQLDLGDLCSSVEVAGPGYVNLVLRADLLSAGVIGALDDERDGVRPAETAERVVVDYSAPNVAKEMHVGHLRSTVIGDALARLLEFLGHAVIRQNHLGDWGTPFGMLIEHLLDVGETEAAHELSIGDLNGFYQHAREKFDDDPAFADRARARVVSLQAGDPTSLRLWGLLVDESKRYFTAVYDALDVTLTDGDYAGESSYNAALNAVVDELVTKGLAVEDQGALCVFPPDMLGREGEPQPVIVRKTDGGFGYAATDLAAIRHRLTELDATWLLYVVGAPQANHLEAVIKVAVMAGWLAPPARAEHVAFGNVLGADGKMFRTRAGETVKLGELLDEAASRALAVVQQKNPDLPDAEKQAVAHAIGIGAVKYADLSSDRVKDYVFDWDRMLALNGNTAPYLQYAHARIRSILRRAAADGIDLATPAAISLDEPAERSLALQLLVFDTAVRSSAETAQPHRLCTYLYELASDYTTFYEACPVLRADSDEVRASRLALCRLTARVLERGLGLLGIDAPERI